MLPSKGLRRSDTVTSRRAPFGFLPFLASQAAVNTMPPTLVTFAESWSVILGLSYTMAGYLHSRYSQIVRLNKQSPWLHCVFLSTSLLFPPPLPVHLRPQLSQR